MVNVDEPLIFTSPSFFSAVVLVGDDRQTEKMHEKMAIFHSVWRCLRNEILKPK